MKYLAFLTLLLFACNNRGNNFTEDNRKSTLEEVVKSKFDRNLGVYNEESAFYRDFNKEILKTLRIVQTDILEEKYHFVFVDFTVGTKVYREVIEIIKMYDGNYIEDYIGCYSLKCPDELKDKIDEWENGSVRKSLNK